MICICKSYFICINVFSNRITLKWMACHYVNGHFPREIRYGLFINLTSRDLYYVKKNPPVLYTYMSNKCST